MTQLSKIVLDIWPFRATEADRKRVTGVSREAEIHYEPRELDLERFDGRDVEVLISEFVPRDLSRWPTLKFVQLVAAGIDHLRGNPIWETEIPVATASGIHGVAMGQFATCALLMMVHRMPELIDVPSPRKWSDRESLEGFVLRGLTAGIIGYGSVGRECARQLHALGMRVLCVKREPSCRRDEGFNAWPGTGDPDGKIPEGWFSPQQLREMLPFCDALIVAAPSTSETVGMIGSAELSLMKRTARIVVVSRGGIVDEEALKGALCTGQIAGAAVDAFVKEPPPPTCPLFDAPNLILTPHMSGVYDEYWPMLLKLLCENLRRLIGGEPLLNLANGKEGY